MPAMVWFGRQWRMASDDFLVPLFIQALLSIPSIALLLAGLDFRKNKGAEEKQSSYLPRCDGASNLLQWSLVLLLVSHLMFICTASITVALSLRGSVFEPSKRKYVGLGLYFVTFSVLMNSVLSIMCSHLIWGKRELRICTREIIIIEPSIILSYCFWGFYILFLASAFDLEGRRRFDRLETYSDVWWKRLQLCCCGWVRKKSSDYAYESAAAVLAQSFRAYNIVPSDIVAGVLLLHGYQSISLREAGRSSLSYLPLNTGKARERLTLQSVLCPTLTIDQVEMIHTLRLYSRFYIATYGLMLRNYERCCAGNCDVLFHDPLTCCRKHTGTHYGAVTYCDLSTVLLTTRIPEEDILVGHWNTGIYKPVHYIAFFRETNAIVVAIRGTSSLADCITDISALPTVINLNDIPENRSPDEYFVHGGFYESAKYVHESLLSHSIITDLCTGKYAECNLIILGHSLGAGVALVLSTLLWSRYEDLRSRIQCLAYSPPGGVLSAATVEYCSSFTIGCFYGQDMIPRIAQHTFDRFREEIFDLLAASRNSKASLFVKCFQTTDLVSSFHPSTCSSDTFSVPNEAVSFRNSLRFTTLGSREEAKKMYPCKRLFHFRKVLKRKRKDYCRTTNEEIYVPVLEGPHQVQTIIASPTMFTDHFPDVLFRVLEDVCEKMNSGELQRYFTDINGHNVDPSSSKLNSLTEEPDPLAVRIPALEIFV